MLLVYAVLNKMRIATRRLRSSDMYAIETIGPTSRHAAAAAAAAKAS